jgi:hypothetical protein
LGALPPTRNQVLLLYQKVLLGNLLKVTKWLIKNPTAHATKVGHEVLGTCGARAQNEYEWGAAAAVCGGNGI